MGDSLVGSKDGIVGVSTTFGEGKGILQQERSKNMEQYIQETENLHNYSISFSRCTMAPLAPTGMVCLGLDSS